MSSVLWDPTDDLAVEQLLLTAGWGVEVIGRCRGTYDVLLQAAAAGETLETGVVALLVQIGVRPASLAHRIQRAIFRRGPSALAFEEPSSASSRSTRQRPTAAYGMASAHNTFSGRTTRTRTGYSSRTSSRNYCPMYALLMATRHCRQRTRSPRRPPWHLSWRGRSSAVQQHLEAAA